MAEFITEATANLSQGVLPVFYKYRYTFEADDDLEERKMRFKHIFHYIKDNYAMSDKLIGGMEEFTKGMVSTKPHCHIHFVSKHKSDTIRKGLMRHFDMKGRVQCCKPEVIVDEPKFWRYPLKQQLGDTKRAILFSGFEKEWVTVQTEIAYACWKQVAELYINKIEKKLEKTARDRLFCYFDNLPFVFKSVKQSYCMAYQYFAEHEETLCLKTVNGYVNIYLAKGQHITYEELYEYQLLNKLL